MYSIPQASLSLKTNLLIRWRRLVKQPHFFVFHRLYFSLKHDLSSRRSSQYQCSVIYNMRLPPVYAVLTFKCHLQVCWGSLLLLHKFDEKLVYPRINDSCRKGYQCFVFYFYFFCPVCSVELTLQKTKEKCDMCDVFYFQPVEEWQMKENRSNACNTLSMLSQEVFPSDLSMGELSDTSSAVLTRRYRSLIEVGLSLPSSPMILFSMGQWEVGGTPWRTRHWWDCYLPPAAPLRGC